MVFSKVEFVETSPVFGWLWSILSVSVTDLWSGIDCEACCEHLKKEKKIYSK